MKLLICLLLVFTVSCAKKTPYGDCVGIDKNNSNPSLNYEINTRNLLLGIIFLETIIVPFYVATDYIYCPVSKKDAK